MSKVNFKAWIHASRLRTLPLSISGVLMGSFIAVNSNMFRLDIFLLAMLTTLLLQILSNLANDYGDYSHGVDNESRVGPKRAVQSGDISIKAMKKALFIVSFLTLLVGISLLLVAFKNAFSWVFVSFFVLGIAAIAAAIKYTVGKSNYGYKGMGDIMVFLFFGPVAIIGTYFLHSNSYQHINWFPAITIGLLSAGVLNINNMRDVVNDSLSGKITTAVKLKDKSKVYHMLIITIAIICLLVYYTILNKRIVLLLFMIPILILSKHLFKVWSNKIPQKLDPELKILSLTTLLISILFGIGIYW